MYTCHAGAYPFSLRVNPATIWAPDGIPVRQAAFHSGIDVTELRVPVRMVVSFLGFPVALEAVVEVAQKLATFIWLTGWRRCVSSWAIVRVLLHSTDPPDVLTLFIYGALVSAWLAGKHIASPEPCFGSNTVAINS